MADGERSFYISPSLVDDTLPLGLSAEEPAAADDVSSRALVARRSPSPTTPMGPRVDVIGEKQQREAETLALTSVLELRDELKTMPHPAAVHRVNELRDAVTWKAQPPGFWPTPSRKDAAHEAAAKATRALQEHEEYMASLPPSSMLLPAASAQSPAAQPLGGGERSRRSNGGAGATVATSGAQASGRRRRRSRDRPSATGQQYKYRPITPELIDTLSQLPAGWGEQAEQPLPPPPEPAAAGETVEEPLAHEMLRAQQDELAGMYRGAQATWFEQYHAVVAKFAPRHDIEQMDRDAAEQQQLLLEDRLRGVFADEEELLEAQDALRALWDMGGGGGGEEEAGEGGEMIMVHHGDGAASEATQADDAQAVAPRRSRFAAQERAHFRRSAVQNVRQAIHEEQRTVGLAPLQPAEQHEETTKREDLADWLAQHAAPRRRRRREGGQGGTRLQPR